MKIKRLGRRERGSPEQGNEKVVHRSRETRKGGGSLEQGGKAIAEQRDFENCVCGMNYLLNSIPFRSKALRFVSLNLSRDSSEIMFGFSKLFGNYEKVC